MLGLPGKSNSLKQCVKQVVTSFIFQEMKNIEIPKEKLWEAEKRSSLSQGIHFLTSVICEYHLI